jgi:hypothetical protein
MTDSGREVFAVARSKYWNPGYRLLVQRVATWRRDALDNVHSFSNDART